MLNYHKAEEGKVWKHKATGSILSSELYLGKEDNKDNYEQVEEALETEEQYEEVTDN